ncbi:MAG: RNA polymerase sigma factor [Bacteroides sp.]
MNNTDFRKQLLVQQTNLLRYARSLTGNIEDANDLLQETFLRALLFQNSYQEGTNLRAWVFTIMRHTFINHYRRNMRKNTTFDSTDNQVLLNNRPSEQQTDELSSYNEMNNAIEQLGDDFRIPFKMHTEGYKYREIAEKLDLCIGTVKSRIFFSRQRLMQMLPGYVE